MTNEFPDRLRRGLGRLRSLATIGRGLVLGVVCLGVLLLAGGTASAAPSDLDPSFGDGGQQLVDSISGVMFCCRAASYPGGKFVVTAHFYNSPTVDVARFNADGSLDTTFDPNGSTPGLATVTFGGEVNNDSSLGAIAVDSKGRIVVLESVFIANAADVALARLNSSGALDTSFNKTGIVQSTIGHVDALANGMTLMPDDRIVVGAAVDEGTSDRRLVAARFAADGTFDQSFGSPFAPPGSPQLGAPLIASDGQGRFIMAADAGTQQVVARLDGGGRLDPSFDPGGNPAGTLVTSFSRAAAVTALAATGDGRPVLAGLQFPQGAGRPVVERFTVAGALDTSFGSGGTASCPGLSGTFTALARQNDGSWVVAGQSNARFMVGRLTEAGLPDAGFSPSGTVTTQLNGTSSSYAEAVIVDGAGRILAVGDAFVGSVHETGIARYLGGPAVGAPTVSAEAVLQTGTASATVAANINPNGSATHYHAEWGLTADYGSTGPTLPATGGLTGSADQSAAAQLTGLSPHTTYHWRIVASSERGTRAGADETVTTASAGGPGEGGGGGNPPPTATFTVTPPSRSGARTLISAAGSSGNGSPIVSYKWDWTGSGDYSGQCGGGDPVAMPLYTISGTYHVGLLVTTADGQSSSTSQTVTVSHVPTGVRPNGSLVHGYSCGSVVGNALCTNHIAWDLVVADALDNGCFEEVPVHAWRSATAVCGAVCAGAASAAAPVAYVSPAVAKWFRQTDAKTWKTSGRVLINGTILAPLRQIVVVGSGQGRLFTVRQALVLIDEADDTIYSPSADVSVKSLPHSGLPDTVLARNQTVNAHLPASAALPTTFGSSERGRARVGAPVNSRPLRGHARGAGLDAHTSDALDAGNPCEDPQVQRLPTLATFPDPAQVGLNSTIDGFPLAGGPVAVHVVNNRVIVCVDITLPSLSPCLGDDSGGFKLRATLLADQGGLELQNLRARLPCAVIAGVVFSDVFFNYDANGHHWTAGGTVEAIPGIPLTGVVEFDHGEFVHAGASLDTSALVTPPIQVTSAGIGVYPDHTTGQVGLGLYPVIPGINKSLLDINGHYELNWGAQPPYFRLAGTADTLGIPLANGALTVYPDHVQLEGHVEANFFGAFTAKADLLGEVWHLSPLRFNILADATLSVFDLVDFGGQLLVSDNGAAACVAIDSSFGFLHFHLHIGAAVNWDPFGIDAMFTGCDVGVERDACVQAKDACPPARDALAHGSAAAAGFPVPVRRGTQYEIFGIDGAGASPAVELHGPRGETLRAQTAGPMLSARYVVLHEAASNATFVIVNKPAPGTWSVAPLPGSTAITAVHYATSLPPVSINARVSGKARHRTLSYRIRRIAGQRVRFLERGPGTLHPIAVVPGGGNGKVSFKPAPGPGGRRQVVAIVEQYGRPRSELTVARYIAPPPQRLTRPRGLHAVRARTSLRFTWRRVAGADAYAIAIHASDHRAISTLIARPRFTLIDVAPRTSVRITVRAVNAHQRGPAASLTARAAKHRPGSRRGGSHAHH